MNLAVLTFIIIGVILFVWANIYTIKELIACPFTNNDIVTLTIILDVILLVIGMLCFYNWASTIILW